MNGNFNFNQVDFEDWFLNTYFFDEDDLSVIDNKIKEDLEKDEYFQLEYKVWLLVTGYTDWKGYYDDRKKMDEEWEREELERNK